jgi:hypothetical protein
LNICMSMVRFLLLASVPGHLNHTVVSREANACVSNSFLCGVSLTKSALA